MTCLLGVCDVPIPSSYQACSQTNKIGGTPNWPADTVLSLPNCQVCNSLQSLIVQLYCCLDKSNYHRTLYVFACTSASCWNEEQSWTVYRCQSKDDSLQQSLLRQDNSNTNTAKCPDVSDVAVAVDDWGVDADDWGVDADDWGDAADDWNDGSMDYGDGEGGVGDKEVAGKMGSEPTVTDSPLQDKHEDVKQCTSVADASIDCTDLQQLCIDDVTDDIIVEEKHTDTSHVFQEDMPTMSQQEKTSILQTFCTSSSADSGLDKVLTSYFINVFEEASVHVEDNDHVSKLLKAYQHREGCNVKEMLEDVRFDGSGKMEKYERSALLHKDVVFHKFIKRLSLCAEQCVRYQWNGSPIFNGYPSSSLPTRCCHCGGEVVFELQLTPALVNCLRLPGKTEPAVEFGTAVVYTCKQSCWDHSVSYRTEHIVVQPDPDQHLFK